MTGVNVRETVPDSMMEAAQEIRLIDLPPEELLERLAAGKVYVPEQARRAVDRFFGEGNLIALRELSLRQTAERVDAQMHVYRRAHGIEKTWAVSDRILVGVSASPYSARLLRSACRMASSLHVPWLAAFVETAQNAAPSDADKARLAQNLRLAEQLGAEVQTIAGVRAAEALLAFARQHNVTKVVVGKPRRWPWRDRLFGSFIDELLAASGDIDIFVTSGEEDGPAPAQAPAPRGGKLQLLGYPVSAAIVAAATCLGYLVLGQYEPADAAMLYILGIVLVSLRYGQGPSLAAALLSVLAFDFFFIPPFFSFAVSDVRHIVTFGVMVLVALVISGLTRRVRAQVESARERERRTTQLYSLSSELARVSDAAAVRDAAGRHLSAVFDSEIMIFLPGAYGVLELDAPAGGAPPEEGVIRWVWENRREAGVSTETLAGSKGLYLPLQTPRRSVGVLGLLPRRHYQFADAEQKRLLGAFAAQIALAMERIADAEHAQRMEIGAERERLRGALLSSVSHDLRTPLAAITGAASALLDNGEKLPGTARYELLTTIHEEANRLNRLVRNLLDMTRLESGAVEVQREWQPLEEVVGSALRRLDDRLIGREVRVALPRELPLVPIDGTLVEQALVNLLENAVKYTPAGSPIEIRARAEDAEAIVEVADRGEGIPAGEESRIFEKFYRSEQSKKTGGAGLGLAICQAIVQAHGGRIWAENRHGGGAVFRFSLPIVGKPPKLDTEEAR